jgi:hypothetical protein
MPDNGHAHALSVVERHGDREILIDPEPTPTCRILDGAIASGERPHTIQCASMDLIKPIPRARLRGEIFRRLA